MENLLLTYHERKANNVEIFQYPDGQMNVRVDLDYYTAKHGIDIKCSIREFKELEVFLCIIAALRKADRLINRIEFVYLFGMRSDRAFELGQPNYFRDVLAPILSNIIPVETSVRIFSPHKEWQAKVLGGADETFMWPPNYPLGEHVIIGGDMSVTDWHCEMHFIKTRTEFGVKQSLEENDLLTLKLRLLQSDCKGIAIVDDLCDGGATFIAAAKYLGEFLPDVKIDLIVMHGLFSKGVEHVAQHFNHVYCSNSYMNRHGLPENTTQFKVI